MTVIGVVATTTVIFKSSSNRPRTDYTNIHNNRGNNLALTVFVLTRIVTVVLGVRGRILLLALTLAITFRVLLILEKATIMNTMH